jgi:alpha-L-rhamnosidase
LSIAADLLGRPNDAARYSALATNVSAAYQTAYWNGSAYPTQCTAGFALALNITPPSAIAAAQAYLLDDVIARGNVTTSGEIGNRYALLALAGVPAGAGNDAIWSSLLRSDAPGYGWMLTMGETALAESWFDAAGDSHIHAMYGHIDEWLYRFAAGIQQDGTAATRSTGWSNVRIAPVLLPGVFWLQASFDSPRGLIFVEVSHDQLSGVVNVMAEVPPGVIAHVVLPRSHRRVELTPGIRIGLRD